MNSGLEDNPSSGSKLKAIPQDETWVEVNEMKLQLWLFKEKSN